MATIREMIVYYFTIDRIQSNTAYDGVVGLSLDQREIFDRIGEQYANLEIIDE